jgi:hypothetical protein
MITRLTGNELFVKLKIINIHKNEARAMNAETRMDGPVKPFSSIDNTRDT